MKAIMAKTPHDSSFSSSRRHFQWRRKKEDDEEPLALYTEEEEVERETSAEVLPRKKAPVITVLKLRSVLTHFSKHRSGLGNRVTGTLFGFRRGHVHFAFQEEPRSPPAFLIELATPTSGLVREMASGLVRIALECEKKSEKKSVRLIEENLWWTYCNGKKCGYAMKRECSAQEWKVLKAVEPISMGAGVLPGCGSDGEMMYMRARFERVVGSRDSEAFYMMNPDGSGGPELSIYLLRV